MGCSCAGKCIWVETKGPMVKPFALSQSELANSIMVKKKKKKMSSFVSPRDVFYLHRKSTSLLAENEQLRRCMHKGLEYTIQNIGKMNGFNDVLPYPCTRSL